MPRKAKPTYDIDAYEHDGKIHRQPRSRLLEALTQRLDAHDGQMQSVGRYMHDHSIKIGYRRVE